MAPTAKALAREFPVHVPDLPGHGRSETPARVYDTKALAASLASWMQAVEVIAELAVERPKLVDRVVDGRPGRARPASAVALGTELLARELDAAAGHVQAVGPGGARVFAGTLLEMDRHRIETLLPRIEAPALVVRGSRDRIIPQRWAEEAAGMLPRGRLEVISGETHTIVVSAPERLAAVVVPFLVGL